MAVRNCCYGNSILLKTVTKVGEAAKGVVDSVGQMRRPTMYRAIRTQNSRW